MRRERGCGSRRAISRAGSPAPATPSRRSMPSTTSARTMSPFSEKSLATITERIDGATQQRRKRDAQGGHPRAARRRIRAHPRQCRALGARPCHVRGHRRKPDRGLPSRPAGDPARLDQRRNRSAASAAPARRHPSLSDGARQADVAAARAGVDAGSPAAARPARPPSRSRRSGGPRGSAPTARALALAPCSGNLGPAGRSHRGRDAANWTPVCGKAEGLLPAPGGVVGRERRVSATVHGARRDFCATVRQR